MKLPICDFCFVLSCKIFLCCTCYQPLGKNGFVEEILDTGDVKISVQESGKQFAIPFIFNPSALVPVFSINDDTKATSPNIVDYMSSEAGNLSKATITCIIYLYFFV